MGCDIHVFIERKHDDGRWVPSAVQYERPMFVWRNYNVFGALSGMRRETMTPIDEPRGLPEDCHKWTREHLTGPDIHGCSWLTFKEIYTSSQYQHYIRDTHFDNLLTYADEDYVDHADLRVVFGYDN